MWYTVHCVSMTGKILRAICIYIDFNIFVLFNIYKSPNNTGSHFWHPAVVKSSHCNFQADEGFREERKSLASCRKRLELIREAENPGPQFKRRRMDRFMVDHLLRNGYYDAAVEYARKANIQVGVGLHSKSFFARKRRAAGSRQSYLTCYTWLMFDSLICLHTWRKIKPDL